MLSSFRDRMKQLSDDMNGQGNEDRPSGRGARRRGYGEDGGGDGDSSNPPSSSTSQARLVRGMDQNVGLPTRRPRSRRLNFQTAEDLAQVDPWP
eukprot:5502539-Amphidinium_carterae.1